MGESINITINGKDNLSGVVQSAVAKSTANLKQLGRDISQVGMGITAAFTLPIALAVKGLASFGADASKQLATLQANLDKAVASGDSGAIAEATAAMNALAPATKEAALAYNEMQAAMQPVNDEIAGMKAQLLEALVPVLKDLMPTLKGVADYVKGLVDAFSAMPTGAKEAIIGVVGFLAVLGPGLVIIGNVVKTVGTLQMLLPGLSKMLIATGDAAWASLGPFALLAGVIAGLFKLIWDNKGTLAELAAIVGKIAFGIDPSWAKGIKDEGSWNLSGLSENVNKYGPGFANGGRFFAGQPMTVGERGTETIMPLTGGYVIPNGGGQTINVYYQPAIGMASEDDVRKMAPLLKRSLRYAA